MTTRQPDRARELFHAELPTGYELNEVCTDEWLAQFPGGFAPISRASAGSRWEYCPDHLAELGEGLSDRQFDLFCEAILVWQRLTLAEFMVMQDADLIVLKFMGDHPNESHLLTVMASRRGLTLSTFVGAHR